MLTKGTGRPRRKRLSWESRCEIVAKVVEAWDDARAVRGLLGRAPFDRVPAAGPFRGGRLEALRERRSTPRRQPRRLAAAVEDEIVAVRRRTSAGPQVIGAIVGIAASTVGKVLRRRGESRLPKPERDPVVRYEWERPGELVHVDSKKLGCFFAVGKRVLADGVKRSRRVGWQYLHVAIDVECPRFGGQLSAGLSGPAERLSGHATKAEVPEAVPAGVSP